MLKQKELELELMTSKQMHEDLRREKREGEKRLYTLEAELFLSKLGAEDLANENEELRQEKVNDDKERFETARRAKQQKLSARRHVLQAFKWKKETVDPVLLEAACAFWNALGGHSEGCEDWRDKERVSCLERKISWKQITLEGWNGDMEKQLEAEFILKNDIVLLALPAHQI